jgi:hypothetical protein
VRDWISALYPVPLAPRFRALLATLSPDRAEPLEPLPAAPSVQAGEDTSLTPALVEQIAASVSGEPLGYEAPPLSAPAPESFEPLPAWTLEEAREALRQASTDREAIKDVTLRFALQTFDFAAAFAVIQGSAVGWDAQGADASPAHAQQISFPLDSSSVFRTVALSRSSYAGPPPPDPLTQQVLEQLGRRPRAVVLFAVEVKHRLVAIFYGDAGARPPSQRAVNDWLLFCQGLSQAFQELILSRKQ